ncbi:hypothetical protein OBBRIDRAFT_421936 [Obba rivulosa]|uniref:DUF6533 domain-containing protein n=1 Tax=Obba rivulosa TaxID=1052685 RepID=A0A8E2AWY8_9APHY|nr:hypothetical protein OBBRIDRAFT_421936 [Obba rivulosa]
MSSFSPELTSEVTSIARSLGISYCCITAGSTLVFWDHLSSFSKEAESIWGRRLNSVTLLFYLNRWATFAWALVNLTNLLPLSNIPVIARPTITLVKRSSSCLPSIGQRFLEFGSMQLVVGTHGLRSFFVFPDRDHSGHRCAVHQRKDAFGSHIYHVLAIVSRVSTIVSDLLVLWATWYKTFMTRKLFPDPLLKMLLRDGTVYFLALLALNVLNIVGWSTNVFIFSVEDFTTPLSSVIMSHFLMNLRQLAHGDGEVTADIVSSIRNDSSHTSNLRFSSFIDNMGELLDHGFGDNDAYETSTGPQNDHHIDDNIVIIDHPSECE